jgi:hypothetical protein
LIVAKSRRHSVRLGISGYPVSLVLAVTPAALPVSARQAPSIDARDDAPTLLGSSIMIATSRWSDRAPGMAQIPQLSARVAAWFKREIRLRVAELDA